MAGLGSVAVDGERILPRAEGCSFWPLPRFLFRLRRNDLTCRTQFSFTEFK